jgi:Ca2+-binding RTX toxin-like protein
VGEADTILPDIERIVGGTGSDVLGGITTNREYLDFEGHSRLVGMTLEGRAGNDILRGTRAQDAIVGGFGNDRMKGGRRGDTIKGGPGGDVLIGGAGRDTLRAGDGEDRLRARDNQRDRVNGGGGSDSARIDVGLDVTRSIATFF